MWRREDSAAVKIPEWMDDEKAAFGECEALSCFPCSDSVQICRRFFNLAVKPHCHSADDHVNIIDHPTMHDSSAPFALLAAQGYLELGMPQDALREFESLPQESRNTIEALTVLKGIHEAMENSEGLTSTGEQLCVIDSDNVERWIDFAIVLSEEVSLESAKELLLEAVDRFPETALLHFHLARFACSLGNLTLAKKHLNRSKKLCPLCRVLALTDESDFLPIWADHSTPHLSSSWNS